MIWNWSKHREDLRCDSQYSRIKNGNIELNRKNAHERGYVETSVYQIIISNYKAKMNRHLWLCRRSVERWIGKKILLGTENHRKENINVPNSFKPQGNNRKKKTVWIIATKQVQETRTSFYQLIKQKDAKGKAATKKYRSWNSCWATRLFFKDLSSIREKQKLSVVPLHEIYMFTLKCYSQTNHFRPPPVSRPKLWENLQRMVTNS